MGSARRWRCRFSTAWSRRLRPRPGRLADCRWPTCRTASRWRGGFPPPTADDFELTPILQPLAPFRDRMLIVTGLANQPAYPVPGEGTGDHVRASATFLTGVHPKKTEGPDIRAGVSMDQIAARELGPRYAAVVARAVPRHQRADWRVRSRLQLRLCQHALLAQRDDAAADGESAAGRVRAPVRRQRRHHAGGQTRAHPGRPEHPRFARAGSGAAAATARRRRPGQDHAVPRCDPRHRASNSEGGGAEPPRAAHDGAAERRHSTDLRRARQADVRPAGRSRISAT